MDSPLVISIDKAWAALHNALGRARRRHRTESDDAQYTQASMPVGLFLSSAPSLQPNPHASAMSFQLPQPRPRRIVRMPLPFASITSQGPPAATSASVPALVRTGTQPANSAADRQPSSTSAPREEPQERILISEVEVVGCDGELKDMAKSVLKTRPNFAYTINEVKQDVGRVFATGWFRECIPDAVDTRDGVKLVIKVTPNDEVRGLVTTGANVLPNTVVEQAFKDVQGKTLNLVNLRKAVSSLDQWYSERGILAQVTDFEFVDGVINLECAEAVVGDISLNFLDAKTQQPVEKPKTRKEVITRHITTHPGQVYNLKQAKRDISSIYATGLFEDVNITPKEADDSTESAPKVDLIVNLVERKTGGLGAGGGLSTQARGEGALPGFVGNFSYSERNLFGLNQRLSAVVEIGQVDKFFKIQHTDPWILGDPHRTSRTIQVLNNRASGAAIHGRAEHDTPPAASTSGATGTQGAGTAGRSTAHRTGDAGNLVIGRLMAGVEYQRPLNANWSGTLGLTACRTTALSDTGTPISLDCYGAPLTLSGRAADHMAIVSTSATYSPPEGTLSFQISGDAAAPVGKGWLRFARLRASVDKPIPLIGPLVLYCRARGGAVQGDLPPYEAFTIGGTNSVRGYAEGGVGTGRRWVEATSELRFPLVSALSGCVFADWGSDLDSGATVIGDPAGARGKPGKGHAFGGGVRVDTPVGPLRLEYAWNAAKQSRFHVGVGYD